MYREGETFVPKGEFFGASFIRAFLLYFFATFRMCRRLQHLLLQGRRPRLVHIQGLRRGGGGGGDRNITEQRS